MTRGFDRSHKRRPARPVSSLCKRTHARGQRTRSARQSGEVIRFGLKMIGATKKWSSEAWRKWSWRVAPWPLWPLASEACLEWPLVVVVVAAAVVVVVVVVLLPPHKWMWMEQCGWMWKCTVRDLGGDPKSVLYSKPQPGPKISSSWSPWRWKTPCSSFL